MIPDRVDPKWQNQDTYDFGHYSVMLNAGLYDYHQKWVDAMNTRERQPKNLSNLTISDFTLNSGYRNPHHNRHHAGSTGFRAHMYGYALDVAGRDLDGIAGADRQDMVNAAYAIPAPNRARYSTLYPDTMHVHADWAWPNWYAFSQTPGARAGDAPSFSLPPQGTDSAIENGNIDAPLCSWCDEPAITSNPGPIPGIPRLISCSTCGSLHWECDEWYIERHKTRTCWRCGDTYTDCTRTSNLCSEHGVHIDEAPPLRCSNPYGGTGTCTHGRMVTNDADEHKTTCSTHGDYWECNQPHHEWHRSRTCTRCSQSYQNCGNYSRACLNTWRHTQDANVNPPPPGGIGNNDSVTGDCGHRYIWNQWHHHESWTCRQTNSLGERCTAGIYYECNPHTHIYPTATSTPVNNPGSNNNNNAAPTAPTIPQTNGNSNTGTTTTLTTNDDNGNADSDDGDNTESSVRCGNSYRGPGACIYNRVVNSDPNEHRATCAEGHSYWSCNTSASATHGQHTEPLQQVVSTRPCGDPITALGDHSLQASCSRDTQCIATNFYYCQHSTHTYPRIVCPANRWTSCGGTVSHATTCGAGDTYYTCNPEAVTAHSGHSACPASRWTSCGGTVSHATTCGAGHTYYTCNPEAVTAHSRH